MGMNIIFPNYFSSRPFLFKRKFFLLKNIHYQKLIFSKIARFPNNEQYIHLSNYDSRKVVNQYALNICNSNKRLHDFHSQNSNNPYLIHKRKFSASFPFCRYREGLGSRIFYEPTRKGKYEQKPKSKTEYMRLGFYEIKTEVRKWREEMKEKIQADIIYVRPGDTDRVFNFKTEEDLNHWIVTSDSDHGEGNSYGSLTLSPSGHGLFSGEIDTTKPKLGDVTYAGYSNMTIIQPTRSFKRAKCFDWMLYTHLILRIRGDGRKYLLNLLTSGEFDITWHDVYSYVLHTRGGPYWQDIKIPFSKFVFGALGRIQDKQAPVPLSRIKRFGITTADSISAPFRLEIDFIGVHNDPIHKEKFAYEMYKIPRYIV